MFYYFQLNFIFLYENRSVANLFILKENLNIPSNYLKKKNFFINFDDF